MCGGHLSGDSSYIACLGFETGSHTDWPVGGWPVNLGTCLYPPTLVLGCKHLLHLPPFICGERDLNSDSGAC